jgi:hypothetical protein
MTPAFSGFALLARWSNLSVRTELTVLLLLFLCGLYYLRYTRSPWRKLPPGPRGIPILGNIRDLNDKRWLTSSECKRAYGTLDSRLPSISGVLSDNRKRCLPERLGKAYHRIEFTEGCGRSARTAG